jgi:hypothetical protein
MCTHCNKNELGDEFHYILDCPFFEQYRNIYIPKYYYSSTYVQYIQYTIACYTKYVSNEEMYRDEQFSRLSRSTYSFIYMINEFT